VGIAVDGDADRVVMIDDRGEVLDGDRVIALCARLMQERGRLKGGGVVSTVLSNLGLEEYLAELGLKMVRTQVGDRYVVEAMREGGYNLGGEQSGHVILLDRSTTGDGLMTALQILALMVREKRALSQLLPDFRTYPQRMINVDIAQRRPLEDLQDFQKTVLEVEQKLGKGGRVLVRYSGTELKARVMVEGYDMETVEESAAFLAETLKEALDGAP
jgi:phosphoglucosamine mutase